MNESMKLLDDCMLGNDAKLIQRITVHFWISKWDLNQHAIQLTKSICADISVYSLRNRWACVADARKFEALVSSCKFNNNDIGGVNDSSLCWFTGIHDETVVTADEVRRYQECSGDKSTKWYKYDVVGRPRDGFYTDIKKLDLGKIKTCTGFTF